MTTKESRDCAMTACIALLGAFDPDHSAGEWRQLMVRAIPMAGAGCS